MSANLLVSLISIGVSMNSNQQLRHIITYMELAQFRQCRQFVR